MSGPLRRRRAGGRLGRLLAARRGELGEAAALAALVAFGLAGPQLPVIGAAERFLVDLRIALLAREAPEHPGLLIAEINEETVARLPRRSPIDRAFLGRLLSRLEEAGARAVGLDIFIDQPTAEDDQLLSVLDRIGIPVVLAYAAARPGTDLIQPWQEAFLLDFFRRIDNPRVSLGDVTLLKDTDAVVRTFGLRFADQGPDGFAAALAAAAGVALPAAPRRPIPLAYYGRPSAGRPPFRTLRADAIEAVPAAGLAILARAIEGRIVLIGGNLAGTDRHRTPFAVLPTGGEALTPGVVLHAQALAQLLDRRTLPVAPPAAVACLVVGLVLAGFFVARLPGAARVGGGLAVVAVLWVGAFAVHGGWLETGGAPGALMPLAGPTLSFLGAAAVGVAHDRRRFRGERDFIRRALMHYVPPAVASQLIENPARLAIGGQRRTITLMFTDIADFTTLSESEATDPRRLTAALNDYLGGVTEIIHAHGGTLDKYIGDAVFAFWGAPLDDPEHAAHAVAAAAAVLAFTRALAARLRQEGLALGPTRIGLHTGSAVIGNFGSAKRYQYTAMGDAVNTASRIEGANKPFGTQVLLSETTAALAGRDDIRPVGAVVLKGRSQPLRLFELAPSLDPADLAAYGEAYRLLAADDAAARAAFAALRRRRPDDPLVAFHLARLEAGGRGDFIVLEGK